MKLKEILKKINEKSKSVKVDRRLRKIEKATGIKLLDWQREFALKKSDYLPLQRASGKSIACIFRILLWRTEPALHPNLDGNRHRFVQRYKDFSDDEFKWCPMIIDPDFTKNVGWHEWELYQNWTKCRMRKIKVFKYIDYREFKDIGGFEK